MTKGTNAKGLEQLAEKVANRLSGKKQIFSVFRFPEERVVDWEGDDIDDFLNLCEQSHGPLIYICETRPEQVNADDDEIFSGHIGELSQLEVAFLQDGYFHRFKEATDWWISYWVSQDEESSFSMGEGNTRVTKKQAVEIGARLVRLKGEEIADEFIKTLKESDHPNVIFDELLYEYVRKKYDLPSSHFYNLRGVNEEAYGAFKNLSADIEGKVVDSLLPSFIEWARNNGRDKLLKVDTELFLNENHLKFSKESILALWRKGTYGLKQGRM